MPNEIRTRTFRGGIADIGRSWFPLCSRAGKERSGVGIASSKNVFGELTKKDK